MISKKDIVVILLFFISIFAFGKLSSSDLVSVLEQKKKINPQTALFYVDSLLAQQSLPDSTTAEIHYQKSLIFQHVNDVHNSLKSIETALPYFENAQNSSKLISAILIQTTANIYLGNLSLASAQGMRALALAQELNDSSLICKCYDTLSHIYYSLKDYEQSISYLLDAATLQLQIQDTVGLSATYNNIAIVYKNMLQADKALEYNYKSLDINLQQKNYNAIAKSYSNIGATYQIMERYEEAMKNYNKAIRINEQYGISNSTPQRSMASCLNLLGRNKEAEQYLLAALNVEEKLENTPIVQELYDKMLSSMLEQQNYQQAILYLSKRDSIEKIQLKQEHQEKLQVLANQQKLLQQENELEATKAKIQKRIFFTSLFFAVMVLLMILIYLRQKNKQLKSQQNQLKLEQKVLRSQMNPHFIFNVMSAIQNTLLENNPLKSAGFLSVFAQLMRQNFEVANKELISLKDELSALENYIHIQQIRFQNSFTHTIVLDPSIVVHKTQIPPFLLQPFVENAIEHGLRSMERNGYLEIGIHKVDSAIEFTIIDNGKGYHPPIQKRETEHALDVFRKRLQLRNRGEEHSFSIQQRISEPGTIVRFRLIL